MKKTLFILFYCLLIFEAGAQNPKTYGNVRFSVPGGTPSVANGQFSFELDTSSVTSAGVYTSTGIKIRNLWSNIRYAAGTHQGYWDGRDDDNVVLPDPDETYEIKILTNNVTYRWGGVIGNSSLYDTGANIHKGSTYVMTDLTIVGDTAYAATDYSEGYPSCVKYSVSNPQLKVDFLPTRKYTLNTGYVCHDDSIVYWTVFDAFSYRGSVDTGKTMLFATRIGTDQYKVFPESVLYTYAEFTASNQQVIGLRNDDFFPNGIAVQKAGNLLFMSYSNGLIDVFNKTSGELINTITSLTSSRGIDVGAGDSLWIITGTNTVRLYYINPTTGVLGSFGTSITGTTAPLHAEVNKAGTLISILDGGNQQNIKTYSTTTGASSWNLGTVGGSTVNASVTDYKFQFTELRGIPAPGMAFEDDGSFWVVDISNSRVQHYDATRNFIDKIASLGSTYVVAVDRGDVNRLFIGFWEYEITYFDDSLSYNLVANWGGVVPNDSFDTYYNKLRNVVTLSNGKTYGQLNRRFDGVEIVELIPGGNLRYTGIRHPVYAALAYNGDLVYNGEPGGIGTPLILYHQALTGFIGDNPTWAAATEAGKNPDQQYDGTSIFGDFKGDLITTDSIVLFWNSTAYVGVFPYSFFTKWHLTAYKFGDSVPLWNQERANHRGYYGPYPGVGIFNIGNNVNAFAGSSVSIFENIIIAGHHDEFWNGNGQSNFYNVYTSNGLAVGQFGSSSDLYDPSVEFAPPGMAGNALVHVVIQNPENIHQLIVFHIDESVHGGAHWWVIDNIWSIDTIKITLDYPDSPVPPILDYTDLMVGLPFNDTTNFPTQAGWTRNFYNSATISLTTSLSKIGEFLPPDLALSYINDDSVAIAGRDLGSIESNDYTISGLIWFIGSVTNTTLSEGVFLELLDVDDKVIARFAPKVDFFFYDGIDKVTMFANEESLYEGPRVFDHPFQRRQLLSINVNDDIITWGYGDLTPFITGLFDETADPTQPKTLQLVGKPPAGVASYLRILNFVDGKLTINDD